MKEKVRIPRVLPNESQRLTEEGSRKSCTGIFKNKLEAWLTFIASDKPEDIMNVVRAYPEFREPYREVFAFRYRQRELISMYSKALSILDSEAFSGWNPLQKVLCNRIAKIVANEFVIPPGVPFQMHFARSMAGFMVMGRTPANFSRAPSPPGYSVLSFHFRL